MHQKANQICMQARSQVERAETGQDGLAPSPPRKMQRLLGAHREALDRELAAAGLDGDTNPDDTDQGQPDQDRMDREAPFLGNDDVEEGQDKVQKRPPLLPFESKLLPFEGKYGVFDKEVEGEVLRVGIVDGYDFDPFTLTISSEEEGTDDDASRADHATTPPGGEGNEEEAEEVEHALAPIKTANNQFKKYVKNAYHNFGELNQKEKAAALLMYTLMKKKATLDTYEAVMEWHLRHSGKLQPHQSLGDTHDFVARKKLMTMLRKRYNMAHHYAKLVPTVLPHTNAKVQIWRKRAMDNVQAILTDPRWNDDDWLFFDDDPFAPPPEDLDYYADLNTGRAYLETYKKVITKPNQILVGIPLYIDGAVTGQFGKLEVTALKMSIGILNMKARDKEYAWKSLGLVPNYTKADSRGKKLVIESGHIAVYDMFTEQSDDEEGEYTGLEDDHDKAADYHAILSVLLETLQDILKAGMVVDLHFKGQVYKNCELVFFIPYIKCDGDEGDKLCLSYRSRGARISQLCRYCQCPNADTDNPEAKWPYKTEPLLKNYYEAEMLDKLRQLSQISAENAFHGLRFGLHNNRGVHGACPFEMLHAVLLGVFKYVRDCFFAQIGKTSVTAQEINALAKTIGSMLAHQSERDKPRTKFAKGIKEGKLMAKEYTGVLLIMSAILRCKSGQDLLKKARGKNFREKWQRQDWTLLVETLLQWEAYLKEPKMTRKHVKRLEKKHRFLLFLLKKIGRRSEGMGFKVMKFHAVLHLSEDIRMFGVPTTVDTGPNESHHKVTKVAAKMTQKDYAGFEKQVVNRLDDFHVLDMAKQELVHGRPVWEYYSGHPPKKTTPEDNVGVSTGGMKLEVEWDEDAQQPTYFVKSRMKNIQNVRVQLDLLEYYWKIQEAVAALLPNAPFFAEHKRNGVVFRSHPNYRGKGSWRDWVMIQWNVGNFPAQIHGFVDLTDLPDNAQVPFEDGMTLGKGVYAIVMSCEYLDEDDDSFEGSDMWRQLVLDVGELDDEGMVVERKYYLVDTETFKEPIVVFPDIGAKPACRYLMMTPRPKWVKDFVDWLEMPHAHDKIEMLPDPVPVQEEEQAEEAASGDEGSQ